MTSQPIDEDGFHSIAWDDAPPSSRFQPSSASSANTALPSGGMGGFGETESEGGFETISPPSDAGFIINANSNAGDSGFAGSSKGTMTSPGRSEVAQGQGHQRHISSGTVSGERLHAEVDPSEWGGKWMAIDVKDPVKEHEGSKDMFVSYAVRTRTNLANYPHQPPVVRRRFQDFAFLRDHLVKAFPASVVPPIPDKHRMEYIKGDRFSPEFVERRRLDLQRFADRIGRHPILQRAKLVEDFLTSTEWEAEHEAASTAPKQVRVATTDNKSVAKHHHISHPPPDSHSSLVDSLSDTFINAFSRVRKPDQRFVEITQGQERFEEGLGGVEKIVGRGKSRIDASDYQDMAAAYQTLGYLESGITEPLNRFAEKMLDFAALLRHTNGSTTEPFLHSTHALLAHSSSHRGVIKLRDQKQLDFEELSAYLSAVVSERDRLAALQSGHSAAPVGLGTYLRDQVDRIRGTDDIHTRRERMRKMDGKITELQEAVTTAHETSTAFNEQVLREHAYFEMNKQHEMKDMLQQYADGQVEMLKRAMDDWDRIIPVLERIRVDI